MAQVISAVEAYLDRSVLQILFFPFHSSLKYSTILFEQWMLQIVDYLKMYMTF